MTEDSLRCSVTDLLSIFRDSLISLTPTADALLLEWGDWMMQHRDWERLAATVFDVCVRGPIDSDSERYDREFTLPPYDIDVDSYTNFSWITARRGTTSRPAALVRLVTELEKFDTVQVALLDPDTLVPIGRACIPFAETTFAFMRRAGGKPAVEVREIEAID